MTYRGWLPLLMAGCLFAQPLSAAPKDRIRRSDSVPALSAEAAARLPRLTQADAARIALARNGGGKVVNVVPDAGGFRVKLVKNGDVTFIYVPGI